jgi:NAD(P)-dependent dehydrogenase (short-subunit alcohol dehydrogenase family)
VEVSLEGRVAAVTGAGRGIGRAIALALARAGATVALAGRTASDLEAVAEEIEGEGGVALPVRCDVTSDSDVEAFFSRIGDELGGLQILVNNAGGARSMRLLEEIRSSSFSEGIALNLRAPFVCMRSAAEMLFERPNESSVINVVSVLAMRATDGLSDYSGAKAGLVAFSRGAAREWGARGVRVNCIGPGWIDTELSASLKSDQAFFQSTMSQIPLGRWGMPADVAGAAVFLASDYARYITGTTLIIDGGLLT